MYVSTKQTKKSTANNNSNNSKPISTAITKKKANSALLQSRIDGLCCCVSTKKYVQFVRSTKLDDALFFPFLFAKYSLFYQFNYNYNVHGTINKVKYNNQLSIIRISLKLLRATHRHGSKILFHVC